MKYSNYKLSKQSDKRKPHMDLSLITAYIFNGINKDENFKPN